MRLSQPIVPTATRIDGSVTRSVVEMLEENASVTIALRAKQPDATRFGRGSEHCAPSPSSDVSVARTSGDDIAFA